ncbi:hypothetical protein U9M48_022214 [Paspalum notatum var. saurae]|uniref:DDE Tnp4 domain-containing protein n=1 Tax=Paspalum notatum var. saurae TaxID=547442 RepID=A0AAQ3TLF7_PASNO
MAVQVRCRGSRAQPQREYQLLLEPSHPVGIREVPGEASGFPYGCGSDSDTHLNRSFLFRSSPDSAVWLVATLLPPSPTLQRLPRKPYVRRRTILTAPRLHQEAPRGSPSASLPPSQPSLGRAPSERKRHAGVAAVSHLRPRGVTTEQGCVAPTLQRARLPTIRSEDCNAKILKTFQRMEPRAPVDSEDDGSLDDLEEEEELLLLLWWYYHHVWLNPRCLPYRQQSYSGNAWVQHILAHEKDCYDTFRMRKDQFLRLHQVLVDQYGLRTTNNVSSEECLAIFLHIISGPRSNRTAAVTFGHSKSTISLKFRHALRKVYNLGVDIIKPVDPTFANPHPKVGRGSAYYPWFENCIGALDGTHFRLKVSGGRNTNLIGRHMVPTFNVLAVVDLDGRFIFVCSGRPGSMHDNDVLQEALVQYHDHFPHPPQDKFYLVDAAYGNAPGFLAPYRNTRYHLQQFHQGHLPETREELFNYRHAQLRYTVEMAIGQLKNKFRILKCIPNHGLHVSNCIIIACMALHNFIMDNGGDRGGDWTQASIQAGNSEEGVEPGLPDLMEEAGHDADHTYMNQLRDMIAAGMASEQDVLQQY